MSAADCPGRLPIIGTSTKKRPMAKREDLMVYVRMTLDIQQHRNKSDESPQKKATTTTATAAQHATVPPNSLPAAAVAAGYCPNVAVDLFATFPMLLQNPPPSLWAAADVAAVSSAEFAPVYEAQTDAA
jgi:hypothetical protein